MKYKKDINSYCSNCTSDRGAYYDVKSRQADRELEQQKSQTELSKS